MRPTMPHGVLDDVDAGLITEDEMGAIVSAAGDSSCEKKAQQVLVYGGVCNCTPRRTGEKIHAYIAMVVFYHPYTKCSLLTL